MSKIKIWQASMEEDEKGEWDIYLTHNRSNNYWKVKLLLPKPYNINNMRASVSLIFSEKKTKKDILGKLYINGRQWPGAYKND